MVWAVNGSTVAVLNLAELHEVMTIVLTGISIISTLLIIRRNLKRNGKGKK